ncbi:hypothetical protein LZ31DRAFT_197693 [Colletotrichum somersetense]|nr:hypothetical protein LZ31DRAFT_197693 [Colletotrichum somersetense]
MRVHDTRSAGYVSDPATPQPYRIRPGPRLLGTEDLPVATRRASSGPPSLQPVRHPVQSALVVVHLVGSHAAEDASLTGKERGEGSAVKKPSSCEGFALFFRGLVSPFLFVGDTKLRPRTNTSILSFPFGAYVGCKLAQKRALRPVKHGVCECGEPQPDRWIPLKDGPVSYKVDGSECLTSWLESNTAHKGKLWPRARAAARCCSSPDK